MALCVSFDFDGPSPYLWATRGERPSVVGELEQRRFGPRIGVWRILDVLGEAGIAASFFVPGAIAAAYPEALGAILERGHEIALHGYLHERVEALSPAELVDVLARSTAALRQAGVSGRLGYRSPSWEMTEAAWDALRAAEVAYDSSLMGSDTPYTIDGLVEVPVDWSLDDAVFYRYVPGTVRPPAPTEAVLAAWTAEIEAARSYGTCVVLTMHPWISGRGARAAALARLLAQYGQDRDIWWATAAQIADHHRTLTGRPAEHHLRPGAI